MTNSNLPLVDQIGELKARIAPLEAELKTLQDGLKAQGAGRYEGQLYDATISESVRETLDMAAVRAHLSRQFIAAHTNETSVLTLRVTAKKLGGK